jgi:parallel beta-helix repeat protein
MNTKRLSTRLLLLVFVLALLVVAAGGGAGAVAERFAAASASPSPYLVTRSGTSYKAVSQATGTTFTGTLKSVVESAVQSLEASGGGTVNFSAGDFDLGSGFFLLHQIRNITFAGAGMDATVIHNSSSAAADTEPFNFQDTNNVVIRDLTVNAGGALRSTSDAIDFDRGNNSTVERVKITGSRAKGIIFDGKNDGWTADGNTVRDCVIQNVPSNGIELLASNSNLVEGCTISNTGRTGIEIGKASATATQANKKSTANIIRNNRIDNAGLNGIYVKSGDRNQILGNTITNSSDDASGSEGTLDGSDPSSSYNLNRVSYNSPFTVSATTTVRFSSLDNAGNVEAAKSQTITITTAAVAAALVR